MIRGLRRPRAVSNRAKSSESPVYKRSPCLAAMMATWASQMSEVFVLPQSSPTSRATASKEVISQKSSARDNKACPEDPRHTWARTVLGTRMSEPLSAATLSALQRLRLFRSRAINAPESNTIQLTDGGGAVIERQ